MALALDLGTYVALLALVSLGLAIVLGLMHVINMAHPEFLTLGAYVAVLAQAAGLPFVASLPLALAAAALIGCALETLLVRHTYGRAEDTILATAGVALVMRQLFVLGFGADAYSVQAPDTGMADVLGTAYPSYRLWLMGVAAAAITLTWLLFFRTRWGLAARAVMTDRATARSLGIRGARHDRATFSLGCGLAGLAGAMLAPLSSVEPMLGNLHGAPAFLSVLVGGMASIVAPVLGSTVLGSAQTLGAAWVSAAWAPVIMLALALVCVRLFPGGLLRPRVRQA
ncbi:Urea ABC transporter, permease protein UrtB [plant metagenome]|uniref:Urea ABC transporter, permease protein UrtB n=1 Tax=plant metagenome TaxID=1297885 RepID=A0A484R364_9ZZZZ